jgi:hypothetical protein
MPVWVRSAVRRELAIERVDVVLLRPRLAVGGMLREDLRRALVTIGPESKRDGTHVRGEARQVGRLAQGPSDAVAHAGERVVDRHVEWRVAREDHDAGVLIEGGAQPGGGAIVVAALLEQLVARVLVFLVGSRGGHRGRAAGGRGRQGHCV